MIYTIYGQPNRDRKIDDVDYLDSLKAVPEGISVGALIVPPIWLAMKRLWWLLAFYALYWVFCMALLATPLALTVPFIIGLPGLYLMLEGWELVRRRLELESLTLLDLVDASGEQEAIGRFLANGPSPAPSSDGVRQKLHPQTSYQLSSGSEETAPTFGMFSPRES